MAAQNSMISRAVKQAGKASSWRATGMGQDTHLRVGWLGLRAVGREGFMPRHAQAQFVLIMTWLGASQEIHGTHMRCRETHMRCRETHMGQTKKTSIRPTDRT